LSAREHHEDLINKYDTTGSVIMSKKEVVGKKKSLKTIENIRRGGADVLAESQKICKTSFSTTQSGSVN
jgi:hypothetical protein